MGKFFKYLKEALLGKITENASIEKTIDQINKVNHELSQITINGEDDWHLCWRNKKDNPIKEEDIHV